MKKIIPHIWFETQARDAASWYTGIFKDSRILFETSLAGTPSGTVQVISLQLMGQEFQFLNAGPLFDRNPSFSYMIACSTAAEVDHLWKKLIVGGQALMPLDTYPFSERFGWVLDQYGLSWQIMHDGGRKVQALTPALLFTQKAAGHAEESMQDLIKLVGDGEVLPGHLQRHPAGGPDREGTLQYARFRLGQQEFVFMDSAIGHAFTFNEMQSLMIYVESQAEIERYSNALSRVPEAEQCGWVKDAYGISWQIVPTRMDEMMAKGSPEEIQRLVQAFLPMKRMNIAALEKAFAGRER
ncbi:MAG TPA: VOC family protein [Oligoflexus sp.]|uniref:VOC family protein n=1 Tax=Oligoflexus sp. TaxID=1971216 RepID=UPI002D7E504C|nr:VOC family protein [Oligoflexus sp.]HET9238272.1 VOC family protein [Oligoflexus sp.]